MQGFAFDSGDEAFCLTSTYYTTIRKTARRQVSDAAAVFANRSKTTSATGGNLEYNQGKAVSV